MVITDKSRSIPYFLPFSIDCILSILLDNLHHLSLVEDMSLPQASRALVLKKVLPQPNTPVYHDVVVETRSIDSTLQPDEILVKISAVAFNHRDVSTKDTQAFRAGAYSQRWFPRPDVISALDPKRTSCWNCI